MRSFIVVCALLSAAVARGDGDWEEEFSLPPPYLMSTEPIGDVHAASPTAAYLTSSRIASADGGALVIDADSGMLIKTDATGTNRAQVAIGSDAGLLAYDPIAHRAYVADRRGDRIVVVAVGDKLTAVATWRTPAEPYGIALAPDRATALVTTIADRTLVAYDVTTGRERWRTPLGAEPRGVAIAPDGKRVAVASLTTGTLEQISLDDKRPLARRLALPIIADNQRARGAFAVTFLGERIAVAPFQVETPVASSIEASDHYGGSFFPPISHRLAWFRSDGRQGAGETNVREPRALAWDASRDTLYLAGLASDEIVAIAKATQVDIKPGVTAALDTRCGADGLAIGDGGSVLVWCSFTRTVERFDVNAKGRLGKVHHGPELVVTSLDAKRHAGLVLFHSADTRIASFAAMSCGNCHLDARADGLSWRIGKHELQTPMLAGRIANTAPYKWDGGAKDLPTSLRATLKRLGGTGLGKRDIASLTAFLEGLPAVRTPTRNAAAIARGQQLFESAELGCASCHEGSAYTDRDRHELGGVRTAFDTPGLVGLAASAPYFHDGSAATLEAALRDRGKVHGMAEAATQLTSGQLADLIAFLETR
jgi:hypothetical protein